MNRKKRRKIIKIRSPNDQKTRQKQERPKNNQKIGLGSQLLAQMAVLGRFWGPWRGQKTTILRGKWEIDKNTKKMVVRMVASAGDAEGGKEGFG